MHLAVRFHGVDELLRRGRRRDPIETFQQSRDVSALMIFVHDRVEPGADVTPFSRGMLRDHFEIYRERSGGAPVSG